jgi:hypothetical protein
MACRKLEIGAGAAVNASKCQFCATPVQSGETLLQKPETHPRTLDARAHGVARPLVLYRQVQATIDLLCADLK